MSLKTKFWMILNPQRNTDNLHFRSIDYNIISNDNQRKIIKEYGKSENDTGSTEVQVALLTQRINDLTDHLNTQERPSHKKRIIDACG